MKNPEQTKGRILQAAFEEIHRHGFQKACLNDIVEKAQVTKGALFHHFASKQEMGYAVVDDMLCVRAEQIIGASLKEAEDPIQELKNFLQGKLAQVGENTKVMECGCPINNLAQEMAPLDEGFRTRIEGIFNKWRCAIAEALEKGKQKGIVRKEVNSQAVAVFFVASFEGMIGAMKNAQDVTILAQCVETMSDYLETLRERA